MLAVLRWVSAACLAALLLVLGLAAAACAYLSTEHGKARLLAAVVADLNHVLPGTISARELAQLSPTRVVLRDLSLRARAGNDVIVLQRAQARLAPWALLHGRVVIDELVLENAVVDLRSFADPRLGLLRALVDAEPSAPPDGDDGVGPNVSIAALRLENCRVRLPLAYAAAPDELWLTTLRARLGLRSGFRLEVQQLKGRVRRQQTDIGGLRASGALLIPGRSHVELGGTLDGVELDADAQLGAEGQTLSQWQSSPFVLELSLRELTAARFASLTGTPVAPLLGSFGTRLQLSGSLVALDARGSLQTPGGALALSGRVRDFERVDLALDSERIQLAQLMQALPARTLAGHLDMSLERRDDAGALATLGAALSADGVSLPRLELHAERAPSAPWQLQLRLDDRWLGLGAEVRLAPDGQLRTSLRGWLSPLPALGVVQALGFAQGLDASAALSAGASRERLELGLDLTRSAAGELDARGTLRAKTLELGAARLEGLDASLSLSGLLPRPRLALDARWQALRRGSRTLDAGRLQLTGGPSRYHLELDGGVSGAVHASAWVERTPEGERFALSAGGRYDAAPWHVEIEPALWLDSGSLLLPAVELALNEQRVRLQGRYARGDARFVLDLERVELQRVLRPFFPQSELEGLVAGRVEARGALERPLLALSLRATRLGLPHAATLDAGLDATLDLARGTLGLDARARESGAGAQPSAARLDVHLHGSGRFDPRARWPDIVSSGEQALTLDIGRLDSAWLAELLGGTTRAALDAHGKASLELSRGVPRLDYAVEGQLAWTGASAVPASSRPAASHMKHVLSHDGRRLHTELALDDRRGRWLSVAGDADLGAAPPPTLTALTSASAADYLRWLRVALWNVSLDLAPRPLFTLSSLPLERDLRSAELGMRLEAKGAPGAAPAGSLAFELAESGTPSERRGCSARLLSTRGQLALEGGRFEAALQAFDGEHVRRLRASTAGPLDLTRWLAGEVPNWAALQIGVDANRLPLDGLPLACGKLRGELSGHGTINPLGTLQASADVSVAHFSLGSDQTVDVEAQLSLDADRLALSGSVLAEGRRSPLTIRWTRVDADNAPGAQPARELSMEFARLPIAPLLPLEGPISHVSGYVSGQLRAGASGSMRELGGSLRLEQVALTVTELAQPLSDISGELSLHDGKLELKRLSGRDGDGELTLDGDVQLLGSRSYDGTFTLLARKFPLRQAGDVVARTSAAARLEASWRPEQHRLRVLLNDFDTWLEKHDGSRGLSLTPHPDVTLTTGRAGAALRRVAEESESQRQGDAATSRAPLLVELDAQQQFWVKRADFALKLAANLRVATGAAKADAGQSDVDITGELRFDRGYMEMLGKSFEVKRGGTLRFTGGTAAVLDLSAEYRDRRTNKLVLVRLQGSADAPKLEFQVDGHRVNAGEAFQAIYGSNASSDDVDPEAQADQIIGALMAGLLTTSMRQRLGAMAPILSVDAADEDRGEQLRAGFELDALIPDFLRDIVTGVYVEGSITSDKQADQAGDKDVQTGVLIELHFPYNLVSSGRYGPDTTWSLDLGWQP